MVKHRLNQQKAVIHAQPPSYSHRANLITCGELPVCGVTAAAINDAIVLGKVFQVQWFSVPLLVDGQFKGVVGNDLALNFIQDLLNQAKLGLYSGAGELALISTNGNLIAATKDASLITQPAEKALDAELLQQLKQSSSDAPILKLNEEREQIQLLLPFRVAGTETRWTLAIELPTAAVLAELRQLQGELATQASEDTFGMALIGLLVAALGLLVIWFVGYSLNDVSWKHQAEVAADLKQIYQSSTAYKAELRPSEFEAKWDDNYLPIGKSWRRNWARITSFFDFPPDTRKVTYIANAAESVNMSLRKITKNRG